MMSALQRWKAQKLAIPRGLTTEPRWELKLDATWWDRPMEWKNLLRKADLMERTTVLAHHLLH
jgi:hypothetical protein